MAFVDEFDFYGKGGKGGDGVVRWRHEKFIAKGGPNGGNGGAGGNLVIRGVKNIHLLSKYKHQKEFFAENGGDGEGGSRQGHYGNDLVIDLPLGSIVTNKTTKQQFFINTVGQTETLLKGGRGGFGNEHFKSSINTTPTKATGGEHGEEAHFHIELELVADVGLVGFPNAGKSSLINALTNTDVKVGNYEFTTLEPSLGDFYGHIIADIPGLIEGASTGRGLGTKFLKHIKRTKKIIHLISLEDPDTVLSRYDTIHQELSQYSKDLEDKEEIILLTKTDTSDPKTIQHIKNQLEKKTGKDVFIISLFDDTSIEAFKHTLSKILEK
jgi:GTP-binding protein